MEAAEPRECLLALTKHLWVMQAVHSVAQQLAHLADHCWISHLQLHQEMKQAACAEVHGHRDFQKQLQQFSETMYHHHSHKPHPIGCNGSDCPDCMAGLPPHLGTSPKHDWAQMLKDTVAYQEHHEDDDPKYWETQEPLVDQVALMVLMRWSHCCPSDE
jgi:hypothetical protein